MLILTMFIVLWLTLTCVVNELAKIKEILERESD